MEAIEGAHCGRDSRCSVFSVAGLVTEMSAAQFALVAIALALSVAAFSTRLAVAVAAVSAAVAAG